MIPVINIGDAIEVRVYARVVTWFSWRTGSTKLWPMVVAMFCLLLPACVGDVWHVDSRFTPEEEQNEFGHALGIQHLADPGALMNETPGADGPTPADVNALRIARLP